ncbi:RdgB/HAM1 family non-canonical purine NTP pyrophosphatase [Peptoniphilus raoultii]|uniref:RdgB/HAM1 family non-canonical purine NTP pyrophosphatase n=1 Tax=Peptoniphilus raoultii TaxID=1776387 RepID=UPI0008D9A928|nr:RdgB/HAM1 family non-canonical purine NTP pyrophosphatase [Peptoniphilus raoultii]
MRLILSTDNENKVREIIDLLEGTGLEILSKKEAGLGEIDVIEDKDTLEGNASLKAMALAEKTDDLILADDTGLFVEALGGEPGVKSARYAGDHDEKKNRAKLLKNLKGEKNRSAYFKTALALVDKNKRVKFLEGICQGEIAEEEKGNEGFGYDPIFIPKGFKKSFGQMTEEEKNALSHRGRALQKLKEYFTNNKY